MKDENPHQSDRKRRTLDYGGHCHTSSALFWHKCGGLASFTGAL